MLCNMHIIVSQARPFTQSLRWERVWSNSHSGLVSTGPGISWTGNWFRVAVALLYKQCGWKKLPAKFLQLDIVSQARPFTQSLRWERVWSNSHSGLVSTGPGISWTGNWFRVAVASLYKQCGWKKTAREVFATRQLFSRGQRAENC